MRESLKSIPGYGKREVDSSDVAVDISDKPSTSTATPSTSSAHSPSSSIHKDRPESSEVSVMDPDSGDRQGQISQTEEGTTVVEL